MNLKGFFRQGVYARWLYFDQPKSEWNPFRIQIPSSNALLAKIPEVILQCAFPVNTEITTDRFTVNICSAASRDLTTTPGSMRSWCATHQPLTAAHDQERTSRGEWTKSARKRCAILKEKSALTSQRLIVTEGPRPISQDWSLWSMVDQTMAITRNVFRVSYSCGMFVFGAYLCIPYLCSLWKVFCIL